MTRPLRPARRAARIAAVLGALAVLAVLLAPEGRLRCDVPTLREDSPDGAWSLTLCRVPLPFAMPGGAGDAPGWIVLRDAEGAIRGVSWLGLVQMYGSGSGNETSWAGGQVEVPMTVAFPLEPATGPLDRWWDDRVWRLRALFGVVGRDDDFR